MTLVIQFLSDHVVIRTLNSFYKRLADISDGEAYAYLNANNVAFHIVRNQIYCGR